VRPEGLGKFKNLPHRVSIPHSALTTRLPRAPEIMIGNRIYWILELATAKDYDVIRTNGSAGNSE
jgi:hypothetical protein